MDWRSLNDRKLAEMAGDAAGLLDEARALEAMGLLGGDIATRLTCAEGRGLWVWLSAQGLLAIGISPDCEGAAFGPASEMFGAAAGAGWITKARAGLVAHDWSVRPQRRGLDWSEAVWAAGLVKVQGKPKARTVHLCKVAEVEGCALVSVQCEDGGPFVPIVAHPAERWIPQTDCLEGYAKRFAGGDTLAGSYMWHVIKSRRAAGLSGKTGKKMKAAKKAIARADDRA